MSTAHVAPTLLLAYGSRWDMARTFGRVVVEPRRARTLFYVECYVDGQCYRLRRVPVVGGGSIPIRSAELADEVLQSVRAEVRNGKTKLQAIAPYLGDHAEAMLISTHWTRFVDSKRRQGTRGGDGKHQRQLSAARVKELGSYLGRGYLEPLLGLSIHAIKPGVLDDWRDWLFDTPFRDDTRRLSAKSVDNVVKDFGTFLRWLVRRGDLPAAPELPRTHIPEHQPRIPSAAVLERILSEIPLELAGSFLARGLMGLRPSEAWRADVRDYDLSADTLSVLGKGGRLRVLPADARVAEWVHAHHDARSFGAAPLFPNPRAEQVSAGRWSRSASRRVWQAACRAAEAVDEKGAPLFPENEGLRHAFGTHAANRGVPLSRVGPFMGHTAEKTTRRYAKLSTVDMVDVLPVPNPPTIPHTGSDDEK